MLTVNHSVWRRAFVVASVLALSAPGARAQAGTFSLDADYTGYVRVGAFSFVTVQYLASGDNRDAPSGLTNVSLDAYCNRDPSLNTIQADFGFLTLSAPDGTGLTTFLTGQGTLESFEGTFTVHHGTGRFEGSTGDGTFHIVAPYGGTPATISIRGTATGTATVIPEPSTLALIALASTGLLRRRQATGTMK